MVWSFLRALAIHGTTIRKAFMGFKLSEDGATSVEYAIVASLIAAVIIAVVIILGNQVYGLFASLSSVWH
ncbi:MAG: Flp family type IVb pilin [Syntrophales bacterium]